jgi:hypothetical protein
VRTAPVGFVRRVAPLAVRPKEGHVQLHSSLAGGNPAQGGTAGEGVVVPAPVDAAPPLLDAVPPPVDSTPYAIPNSRRRCSRNSGADRETFVLIVTFAATCVTGDAHTERIASFDDYQACVSAGQAMYPHQHWECLPLSQLPQPNAGR